jgi:hypothetical protein
LILERYTWADLNPKNWPRKKHIALAIDLALGMLCYLYWIKWLGLAYALFALFNAFFPVRWKLADLDDGALVLFGLTYHWCPDCGRTLTVSVLNLHLVFHIPISNTKPNCNGHNDDSADHPAGTDI